MAASIFASRLSKAWTLGILIAAVAVYAPSLGGDFVLDDWALIVNDPLVHDITNLPKAFSTDFLRGSLGPEIPYFRPLVTASFQINYSLSGPDAFSFRFANVLIHAAAAVLVFLLCLRVTDGLAAAGITGLVFAVTPCHAESVAWTSGRTDVMSCAFMLGALLLLLPPDRKPLPLSWTRAALGALMYLCALLSKEIAVVLPAILFAYALVYGHVLIRRNGAKWLLAVVLPIIIYGALRHQATDVPMAGHLTLRLGQRLLGVGIAYAAYMRMMFLPKAANVMYDVFPIGIKHPWVAAVAWLLPVLMATGAVLLRKRLAAVAFSMLWILISLLPVTNIIPTLGPLPAERFCYLASVGSSLVLGYLAALLWNAAPPGCRLWKPVAGLLISGFILYCGASTVEGTQKYQSNVTWARAIAAGNGRFLRGAAGQYLAEAGLLKEAESEFRAAIRYEPDNPVNYIALHEVLLALHMDREARDVAAVIRNRFGISQPHARHKLNRL